MCVCKVNNSIGNIVGMVVWGGTKWKRIGWILGQLCDFDLTHGIGLGFLNVEFWNSCISGIVGLIPLTLALNFQVKSLK